MLLRRMIEHVKAQNWTAVALDFVIVVVGVFMGLQVQQWAQTRDDRAEEVRYLRALANDMDASITFAREQIDFIAKQTTAQQRLANISVGRGLPIERTELDDLMHRGLYELYTTQRRLVTFDELKNTGKLGLLGDPELRARLQELEAELGRLSAYENDAMQQYYSFSDPFMVRQYDLRGVVSQEPAQKGTQAIDWIPVPNEVETLIAALQTDEFRNIVLFRGSLATGVRTNLEDVIVAYEEVALLVAKRLEELGAE